MTNAGIWSPRSAVTSICGKLDFPTLSFREVARRLKVKPVIVWAVINISSLANIVKTKGGGGGGGGEGRRRLRSLGLYVKCSLSHCDIQLTS